MDESEETSSRSDISEKIDQPSWSDDQSGNDSDRELQVAWESGLLKTDGLNVVLEEKRPPINNKEGLLQKIKELEKRLDWIQRLDVTVDKTGLVDKDRQQMEASLDPNKSTTNEDVDNDFEREILFYKQAQKGVAVALGKLEKLGVPTSRPSDYYAEMAKSDKHMQKVRKKLLDLKQDKEKREAARRLRDERRFASKVQKEVLANRQSEKKQLLEAVKKHRKGMAQQLDDMLENAKNLQPERQENRKQDRSFPRKQQASKSRQFRDQKFGRGGQKKRKKANDKESFAEGFGVSNKRGGKFKMAGRGSKGKLRKKARAKRR